MKTKQKINQRAAAAFLALAAASGASSKAEAAEEATSRTHALLNFEFSDKYLTPRGMLVQNEGLVFQQLALGFFNLYKSENFLNDVTLVGGVWNCFGTSGLPASESGGATTTSWYEIDPIAGFSFGLGKNLKLDLTYTAFDMQVFNIPFSHHLETKLSFDDSKYLKAFALHPTLIFWKELDNKAVANTDPLPQESWYFDLGIAPSYTFKELDLKVEAPMRALLPEDEFYGTGAGSGSTVALYEVGLKATMPLKFMPKGYGNWSAHGGFKWMFFEDENLRVTQGKSDVPQIFFGITTFF